MKVWIQKPPFIVRFDKFRRLVYYSYTISVAVHDLPEFVPVFTLKARRCSDVLIDPATNHQNAMPRNE